MSSGMDSRNFTGERVAPTRKPSHDLLRRAREQRKRLDDGAFGIWSSVNGMERAFYDLAEQIVRECAEIARTTGSVGTEPSGVYEEGYMSGCNRTQAKILRKFGLEL